MALPASHVQTILNENREATREELDAIFQRMIIEKSLKDRTMGYFSEKCLKRIIILELYYRNCIHKRKNRYLVTRLLSTLTGYHLQSVIRLIKTEFEFKEDEKPKS